MQNNVRKIPEKIRFSDIIDESRLHQRSKSVLIHLHRHRVGVKAFIFPGSEFEMQFNPNIDVLVRNKTQQLPADDSMLRSVLFLLYQGKFSSPHN